MFHSLLSKKKDFHFILKNQPQNCCGSTKQKLPSAKKFTESQFLGEIGWVLKKGDEAQDRAADAQLNLLLPLLLGVVIALEGKNMDYHHDAKKHSDTKLQFLSKYSILAKLYFYIDFKFCAKIGTYS